MKSEKSKVTRRHSIELWRGMKSQKGKSVKRVLSFKLLEVRWSGLSLARFFNCIILKRAGDSPFHLNT